MHFIIHWSFVGSSGDIDSARRDLIRVLSSVPTLQLLDGLAISRPSAPAAAEFLADLLNVEHAHDPVLDVAAFEAEHRRWYMVSEPVNISAAIAIAGRPPEGP